MSLASYVFLQDDDRDFVLYELLEGGGFDRFDKTTRTDFAACVNDFALNKRPDLLITEVFGWCVRQHRTLPAKFKAHRDPFAKPVPVLPPTAKERREWMLYCLSDRGLRNPNCKP